MPNTSGGNTGMAQMLLTPIASPFTQIANVCGPGVAAPCRANFVGGPNAINNTKDPTPTPTAVWAIWSGFFDDTWKVTPTLTLNLGLRYDFVRNSDAPDGRGANFLMEPTPTYFLAKDQCDTPLSQLFLNQLASNGIALGCHPSNNLIQSPKNMFAPRVGVAYNFADDWVVRAGGGVFYQTSYRSNILGNLRQYPFEYTLRLTNFSPGEPIIYADGSTATFESGIEPIGIQDPTTFNPRNMGLSGTPSPWKTPYSMQYNVTVQRQLTSSQTGSIGYVGSQTREGALTYNYNTARVLAPPGLSAAIFRQFPDFSGASETMSGAKGSYDSLQLTYDKRFAGGYTTKANYTFQKCRTQARQVLTGGDVGGHRNLFVLGPDWALCNTDAPHLLSVNGTFALPLGRGERFLGNASGVVNQVVGGWRVNVIGNYSSGQPFTIGCTTATTTGHGCNALLTGEPLYPKNRNADQWLNPAAFMNPPAATAVGQSDLSPLGGSATQVRGPDFRKVDPVDLQDLQLQRKPTGRVPCRGVQRDQHPEFRPPGILGRRIAAAVGCAQFQQPGEFRQDHVLATRCQRSETVPVRIEVLLLAVQTALTLFVREGRSGGTVPLARLLAAIRRRLVAAGSSGEELEAEHRR